jgi:hypothetical protein
MNKLHSLNQDNFFMIQIFSYEFYRVSKKVHFWARKIFLGLENFLLKMTYIGVILCRESISRIPEA